MNIWKELKKPIYILAPMEDVTDTVFRQLVSSCGRPNLFFTEFTNVEGMASKGDKIVSQRLLYAPSEKPIIAQIWGKDPTHFYSAAGRITKLGFDGIDINMGCPEKSIVKNGSCAALIKNKPLAQKIIQATRDGIKAAGNDIPVSVKTRLGFDHIQTEDWITFLLEQPIDALTIHGRTAQELSLVPAHWDEIGKAVQLRNTINPSAIIIGNGDITTHQDAEEKIETYQIDGVMIGRGVFQNPYIFSGDDQWKHVTPLQRLELLERHIQLFVATWHANKHFPILKKYVKIYISGFDGASDLRVKCMETQSSEELLTLIALIKRELSSF